MNKRTTLENIYSAIKQHLVTVVYAQTEFKDLNEVTEITLEQFLKDLDSYVASGIFSDVLDFKYQIISNRSVQIQTDYYSGFCQNSIKAVLRLCDGVSIEQVKKQLEQTIFDSCNVQDWRNDIYEM